ncbi:MAG: hypothetical protein JSV67_05120 [Thermoplasmatales archaeon]|nr:MAG: hypothetical protein JSV67_05120 [Thermoplasmatales archaeon]
MSFEKRLEKAIARKENEIEKEHKKIESLEEKFDAHKITRAEFNIKKKKILEKIKSINSRMRVLQGGLTRERRHQDELAEEKRKKKEEKQEKKKKKKIK